MKLLRFLRALVAAVILVAILIGFPVMFYRAAGSPLPDHLLTLAEITKYLTRRDDGTLLISVLQIIAWGAWAAFSFTVVWEIIARVSKLQLAPHLPGLGGMQRLAAYLVTSVVVVVSVQTAVSAQSFSPPVAAVAPLHPAMASHRVYQVEQGDSLWSIADTKLDNPRRWPKIWKLNAYSAQPGGTFTDPDTIQPRWKLKLPSEHSSSSNIESSARQVPSPAKPAVMTPVLPPQAEQPQRVVGVIELPSGSLVAMAYAAGISTAFAANQLRRRWRRMPSPASAVPV